MDKEKASLISERTLWSLYRRTLAAELMNARWSSTHRQYGHPSAAVSAAVAEVRQGGDALALAPGDLATRYAAGMDAQALLTSGTLRAAPRTAKTALLSGHSGDFALRLLPGESAAQPAVAIGAAAAMRMSQAAACVLLLARTSADLRRSAWAAAVESATALHLPIVFVADRADAGPSAKKPSPRQPAQPMPVIAVDRADALALYRVLFESAARAREGAGPTWVDCCEARLADGTLLDAEKGPVERLELALKARRVFTRPQARSVRAGLDRELKL